MSQKFRFDTLDPDTATDQLDDLVACYLDTYDGGDEFHNEDRYRRQITGHIAVPGWQAITATDENNNELAGYIYGFTLPEQTRWWQGLTTEVPEAFTDEDGKRTVAVSELMVRPAYRGQGIARSLHSHFIESRTEHRATLLVRPDNTAAQAAYRSWGYDKVAQLRPAWEHAPLFDVLLRLLHS